MRRAGDHVGQRSAVAQPYMKEKQQKMNRGREKQSWRSSRIQRVKGQRWSPHLFCVKAHVDPTHSVLQSPRSPHPKEDACSGTCWYRCARCRPAGSRTPTTVPYGGRENNNNRELWHLRLCQSQLHTVTYTHEPESHTHVDRHKSHFLYRKHTHSFRQRLGS